MAITCRSFRHLHDAYLDRELSESQMAEVHAHLLQCPECQRQVEIVRACGDVIALDTRTPVLTNDFADRVLATLPARRRQAPAVRGAWPRVRRWLEYGVVPAMAAALTFAVIVGPGPRWTSTPNGNGPNEHLVAGTSVLLTDAVVGPVEGAAASLDQLGRAASTMRNFCEDSLKSAPGALLDGNTTDQEPDFVNELLQPFFDLFDPPIPPRDAPDDVERF